MGQMMICSTITTEKMFMWRISFMDSVRPSSEEDAKMPPIHQFKHASQARRIQYSVGRREAFPTLPRRIPSEKSNVDVEVATPRSPKSCAFGRPSSK